MDYNLLTSLSKFIPIDSSKLHLDDINNKEFSEMFQSASVKRLFNQPNIIIKTISSSLPESQVFLSENQEKYYEMPSTLRNPYRNDEVNLLPSKIQGKSEIALLPIKRERKSCGHYGPCENIICDVNIHQYFDYEESSPVLAVSIDDSEITASVSKHCENPLCDSLNIEHNRCRRAIVYLYRCDESSICDICKISLKTRKSRIHHRNCKRKNQYQHNRANGAQILRERMRERELQMMEAGKTKQNDYSDPLTGHEKAMEVLKNNSELIIIPKIVLSKSQQSKSIFSSLNSFSHPTIENANFPSTVLPNISTSLSSDLQKMSTYNELNKIYTINVSLSEKPKDQFLVTPVSQNNALCPLRLSDRIITPSLKTAIIQSGNPYFMPVKVIPIKSLKSEPSLKHQTQGIPKFCIVPDTIASSPSFVEMQNGTTHSFKQPNFQSNIQNILQNESNNKKLSQCNISVIKQSDHKSTQSTVTSQFGSRKYLNDRKKQIEKLFQCSYCSKRFLTDWYFKLHVTRHTGKINAKCKNCDRVFTSNYDLKKHINIHHKNIKLQINKTDNIIENEIIKKKCSEFTYNQYNYSIESSNKLVMPEHMFSKNNSDFRGFDETIKRKL